MPAVPKSEQHIASMFDRIAKRYDLLNALLSARQDRRWRRKMISMLPYRPDGTLADIATGTGDVVLAAMRARSEYRNFTGVDISSEMLRFARRKANLQDSAQRLELIEASAQKLPFADQSLDAVTIAFGLRNVVDRDKALAEFLRVLKPDGVLIILEFFNPDGSVFSRLFQFYFRHLLPLVGAVLSDRDAYRYLPESVPGFYSIAELRQVLYDTGLIVEDEARFLFGGCRLIKCRPAGR